MKAFLFLPLLALLIGISGCASTRLATLPDPSARPLSAANADAWTILIQDQDTKEPIAGASARLVITDDEKYKIKPFSSSCTTNAQGVCRILVNRDHHISSTSIRHVTSRIEIQKHGFKASFSPSEKTFVTNGEAHRIIELITIKPSQFTILSKNGSAIEGVRLSTHDEKVACITDSSGNCSFMPEGHVRVTAQKEGYVDLVITEQADTNEIHTATLKTVQEALLETSQALEKERLAAAEAQRMRLEYIRSLPNDLICAAYGHILKNEPFKRLPIIKETDRSTVAQEISRRKLFVDKKLVGRGAIRIGMSDCDLMASWGYPSRSNRSVGTWGTDIQYVYEDLKTYIYTRNGKVSSWQD